MARKRLGWFINGRGRVKRRGLIRDGLYNGRKCATADALERSLEKVGK